MLENQEVLSVPDTPETRRIWLSDFADAWIRTTLRKLLEGRYAELIVSFSAAGDDAFEFEESGKQAGAYGQPWFYPRLVAYGYFWFSEGIT
jgi:hypothetical protein